LDQKKYRELFIEEANEQLQNLNMTLLKLETAGDDIELLHEAFRLVHTVKGSSKVLGIKEFGDIAHSTEDILDKIKNKKIPVTQEILDILFESTDIMATMVNELANDDEISIDPSDFVAKLNEILKNNFTSDKGRMIQNSDHFVFSDAQKEIFSKAKNDGLTIYLLTVKIDKACKFKEGRIFQVYKKLEEIGTVISSNPEKDQVSDSTNDVQILISTQESAKKVVSNILTVTEIEKVSTKLVETINDIKFVQKVQKIDEADKQSLYSSDTVRVKSKFLDSLLDLVGELMISEIRVKQIAEDIRHKNLKQFLKNNDRLISEVQDYILRMRMVPIDTIFKRFPRMVRDISKEMGKKIEFQMDGNDIEIDRSLLDDVGDSIMHLLRNSIDHGIELSSVRKKANKKDMGILSLKSYREQSIVVIEVTDDGNGIDVEKIVNTAVSKGLITPEKAKSMDEKEKLDLIFLPGLSTAEKVSEVSGRGVGLDVVSEKIHRLGGSVKIDSKVGWGTKIIIKLPPSMAIIQAMLLEINKEKYAIPLENIVETIKINETEVHNVADNGIFKLRDEVLPIMNLYSKFNGNNEILHDGEQQMPVVIVEKNGSRAGLVVNKLIGQQEIVIKNLGVYMRNSDYFSGATILGDGRVAMILDVEAFL
jgi:two-component system chemotaxis sensor kinase CheA